MAKQNHPLVLSRTPKRPQDLQDMLEETMIVAGRAEAMATAALRELERVPGRDVDPGAEPGAVSRIVVLEHLIEQAMLSARETRAALRVAAEQLAQDR